MGLAFHLSPAEVENSLSEESSVPTMFSRILHLTESDQFAQFFTSWQGEIDQVSRGRIAGRLRIVRGNLTRVAGVECNQSLAVRGRNTSELISIYPVLDRQSSDSWLGCPLRPGQIVVGGQDHEFQLCTSKPASVWGLHLSREVLTEAARTLCNSEELALPGSVVIFSAPSEAVARFKRQLLRLLDMGLADPEFLKSPEGRSIELECIRALVAALLSPSNPPEQFTRSIRSQLLSRAENFLRARLNEPIGMIDLCRAMDANDRTLRLAFRERYGVGPMTYFRILRLNAVRTRLRKDPDCSIAEAARTYGFVHLGNFAADYRLQFGERPSQTVRTS